MPSGTGINDKLGTYAAGIGGLENLLELNLKKCFYGFNRLNPYIQQIEDSEIRIIISLRYVDGLDCNQVAASMSFYATGDSVR